MQTVKLIPPQLSEELVLEFIHCDRPLRIGGHNISLEKRDSHTIVHCYGHGGAGWTTLFGSIQQSLRLFSELHLDPKTPIRVIGSGCMGLTMAIELHRAGYHKVGISTKELYDIPSWKAAGMFVLSQTDNLDTFRVYRTIEQGIHPYLTPDCVRFLPYYCKASLISGIEELEAFEMLPHHKEVALDFGNGVVHPGYVQYKSYFMNTTLLMQQLTKQINHLNIPMIIEEIHSFEGVSEPIIFNCAGLGAGALNHDSHLVPVRGFLANLHPSAGKEPLNYLLAAEMEGEEIYLIPKTLSVTSQHPTGQACWGTLGGTYIPLLKPLSATEAQALAQKEFQKLLDRSGLFFYG